MELDLGTDGNPVIDQLSEAGFGDLTLQITKLVDDKTHYRFHLAASHNDGELGFDVVLVKGIKGGFENGSSIRRGPVTKEMLAATVAGRYDDRTPDGRWRPTWSQSPDEGCRPRIGWTEASFGSRGMVGRSGNAPSSVPFPARRPPTR